MKIRNDGFKGWVIKGDQLISPENVIYSSGEIRSIQYLYAIIADLKLQLRLNEKEVVQGGYDYSNVIAFPDLKNNRYFVLSGCGLAPVGQIRYKADPAVATRLAELL